jgi:hypothetical protein
MWAMTTDVTTPPAATTALSATVDRFLAAAAAGRGGDLRALFAADAVLDATVPGRAFQLAGPERIAEQYARWYDEPGTFDDLVRQPWAGGEAVRYALRSHQGGVPYAAQQCHVFEIDAHGAIRRDTFFCGGRWSDDLLARMVAENAG